MTKTTEVIKKAADGTYYFRANIGVDEQTGKRVQKRRSGFKTKREAKTAYRDLMANGVKEGSTNQITFGDFCQQFFIPWYEGHVKKATFDSRVSVFRKQFKGFNKYFINKITPVDIQKWQIMMKSQVSNSYTRLVQCLLSLVFDRAIVLGFCEENPTKIVGNLKKEKKKVDFWTKAEFEKVISLMDLNDYYQRFNFTTIWLLFMTGARIGEATALQWEDIDFEAGTMRINKTLYYLNAFNYEFTSPKTRASVRTVPLDKKTLEYLSEWEEIQASEVKTDFVLSYNGVPTTRGSLSKVINIYSKAANVHRIRVHALRHSHASLLISIGENPLIIKERLGHEDIQTTLGTYGHLYPNSNFETAQHLNGLVDFTPADHSVVAPTRNQFTGKKHITGAISVPATGTTEEKSQQTPV